MCPDYRITIAYDGDFAVNMTCPARYTQLKFLIHLKNIFFNKWKSPEAKIKDRRSDIMSEKHFVSYTKNALMFWLPDKKTYNHLFHEV